jgi:periplasmic protein TonB
MSFLGWDNAVNPERVELVFADRNKEYGGYVIRRNYQRRVVVALVIAVVALLIAVGVPKLMEVLSKVKMGAKDTMNEAVTLAEPPPIDKTAPPPPPVIPPPPVQQTIKFTPPKVVKDEEAQEPPPTQEETKDVQVSTQTQEGSKDVVDLPTDAPAVDPDEGKVFTVVEEMPNFPGGEEKLFEYLQKNIKYPPVARENGIQGRVYVTFVVDKDGKIKDAKVLRGIGGGCDEEALRVVRGMPEWKPGKQNGRSVQVQYNLPVNFTLK